MRIERWDAADDLALRGCQAAESWDADRVRQRSDAPLQAMGLRTYTVAAVHDASGELAGMSSG